MLLAKKTDFFKINILRLTLLLFCFVGLSAVCSEAKELHPYDKYWNLAMKYQKEKKYREADQVFTVGISKYPRAVKLYFWRAKLRGNYMGKTSEAIIDYTLVINSRIRNFQPKSYYMRGNAYSKLGAYHQALSDLNECLHLNPKYGDRVYIDRARVYTNLKLFDKAKKDIDFLIRKKSKYSKSALALLNEISSGNRDY